MSELPVWDVVASNSSQLSTITGKIQIGILPCWLIPHYFIKKQTCLKLSDMYLLTFLLISVYYKTSVWPQVLCFPIHDLKLALWNINLFVYLQSEIDN